MMTNKKLFYGIAVIFLIGLSLFIWNNYQIQFQERPEKPIKLPPQISGKCGMENCHGLDITCGPNIPEGCTTEFRIDDTCRHYVRCEKVDRECRLVKDPKFEECKSCIERCNREEDPEKAFQCASKCAGVPCGGWDTFGDVVCECVGQLEKYTCPSNTVCDSGTDTCYGNCGGCKCYQGPAKGGIEVPCNGKDTLFK